MSEVNFCTQYEIALREVRDVALTTVDIAFSTGYPDFHNRHHTPLTFHNGLHGRLVSRDAEMLGSSMGLPNLYVATARAAGAAHDLVQVGGSATNEEESAQWLADRLRTSGIVPEAAIMAGSLAILGTKPTFENGILVGQKVTELTYPSKEAELTAKCVAAGDLGHLYRPRGPLFSHLLYAEIHKSPPGETPPLDKLPDFQHDQLTFLETYTYPLLGAEQHLATHKREVIQHTQDTLHLLESGSIDSWGALIQHDVAFMRANSDTMLTLPTVIPSQRQSRTTSVPI